VSYGQGFPIVKVRQGSAVFFRIEVRDLTADDQPLFSPGGGVKIYLRDSVGAYALNGTAMTEDVTGVYKYSYQLGATAALGVWRVYFVADGSTYDTYTPTMDAFEVVKE
jgi:uncharacterized protein YfaS (alpha-2-macroglobulin family)